MSDIPATTPVDNQEDNNDAKTFSVKHEKSDGLLNIDSEHVWCVVGDDTVYDIPRSSIRFCAITRKGVLVINRENGNVMNTLSISSKHTGAIRDVLLL